MTTQTIFPFILAGDIAAIRTLLDGDPGLVPAHHPDSDDDLTTLQFAAANGQLPVCKLLLDAGASIEADEINCYGGKPLHWASEHAPQAVELLLRRGADVNSRNLKADSEFYGMTPLIMDATQKDDCAEVTELLLQAGADIDAVDSKGKTALDYAEEYGLRRIAWALRGARHGWSG